MGRKAERGWYAAAVSSDRASFAHDARISRFRTTATLSLSVLHSVRRLIFGKKLDPFDPKTRKHIVLIALLAWIGLGADGLYSSCSRPEDAFIALGHHPPLALYPAAATPLPVFLISIAY